MKDSKNAKKMEQILEMASCGNSRLTAGANAGIKLHG